MPRFFINYDDIDENIATITGEDVKHITKVLRLDTGSEITLCDSRGYDYQVKIKEYDKETITCDIINREKCDCEPDIEVVLFQGYPKSDKMDYIIQKCCELGITKIVPVITDRTIVKLKDNSDNKIIRLNKISESAAKQSGRGIIPKVISPVNFKTAIDMLKGFDLPIMPYELEDTLKIKDVLKSAGDIKNIGILIGPEGGFSQNEAMLATKCGIKTVSLGNRILRTETAGAVTLTLVMYELDQM